MRNSMRYVLTCLFAIVVLDFATEAARAQLPVDLSGYEIFLGVDCTIGGFPATCGVKFAGWAGGDGQVAGGWTRPPGDRQGLWSANINYRGTVAFHSAVQLLGGSWKIAFKDAPLLSGLITGGWVQWPDDATQDIGCGAGVATIYAALTLSGGDEARFDGCLHDLPIGTAIPPKVWGTMSAVP